MSHQAKVIHQGAELWRRGAAKEIAGAERTFAALIGIFTVAFSGDARSSMQPVFAWFLRISVAAGDSRS